MPATPAPRPTTGGFTATHDAESNLYSGGIAFGVGYPSSPGAFQTTFAGLIDIAIIKYNTVATGPAERVWSTYPGGGSAEFPHSLMVNNRSELLVLGSSGSADYPTTTEAWGRPSAGAAATGWCASLRPASRPCCGAAT